jgi:ABC-type transporter Mla MlaB component
MPYHIEKTGRGITLGLKGGVTVRHAAELGKCVAASLTSGAEVIVQTQELVDIDTSILQMLLSLRKTAGSFVLDDPSQGFLDAMDRCVLRREFLGAGKDAL